MATPSDSPPALATTKRKFHKLLDSLTASTSATSLNTLYSSPNVSTSSLPRTGSPEPLAKRPRSSEALTSNTERQRQVSAGQARIQALKDQLLSPKPPLGTGVERQKTLRVVPKASSTNLNLASQDRKTPNFQPYSQDAFLARLKTFADVKKWSTKPDPISEVAWAKRGWSCDAWNTVACRGGCEKRVVVKLRPRRKGEDGVEIANSEDMAVDVAPGLVERYQELIVEGHERECLWRKTGCGDDIYHIPIASRARSTADLLSRYSFLLAISSDLPLAKNMTHPGPSIASILSRLPSTFFTSAGLAAPSNEAERTAFAFALFGWTGVVESRISLAVCNHCFQRLGLWMSSDARLHEMSRKLDVPVDTLRLNLLESHREHCPWKNGVVQSNSADSPIAGMPAWETLVFMLVGKGNRMSVQDSAGKELPKLPHEERARPEGVSHERIESVDLGSETTYPRGSVDSTREVAGYNDEGDEETITNKWKKFKAKLKRSTSKRSLKSVKSVKSAKSIKSTKSGKSGKENENEDE
ncbi:hypothetical protein E8E12_008615 [Didymella heteroderae]|uniref:Zf-C3HC-domain-containing protein n=1 Tax=Didymella heteroderae TaxID=1769908 RepID=A0A9P4WXH5_9PLEO|nr:hypothetical protein E8E12_008615 [Didymella heteroderae]